MPRTEQDHVDMLNDANKWPKWPWLPLKHTTRQEAGMEFPILGTAMQDPETSGAFMVFLANMHVPFHDAKTEHYKTADEVVKAGWIVD